MSQRIKGEARKRHAVVDRVKKLPCFTIPPEVPSKDIEYRFPCVTIVPNILKRFITCMHRGLCVTKHGRTGKPKQRWFTLEPGGQFLLYCPSKKPLHMCRIYMEEIIEIRSGHATGIFLRSGKPDMEQFAFSLILQGGRSMDLEVQSASELKCWIQSISYLIARGRGFGGGMGQDMQLMHLWLDADSDNSKTLSFAEIVNLMEQLGLRITPVIIHKKMAQHDTDGNGTLEYAEFFRFYKEVTHHTNIADLFDHYSGESDRATLTPHQFTNLMQQEQGDARWHDGRSRALFENLLGKGKILELAYIDLYRFFFGPFGWWYNPNAGVTDDMDQSLENYFIATSHNTFLTGDQLQSDPDPKRYAEVLRQGCRCVEIECADGPDGVPVVRRSYTRGGFCQLEEVIIVISQNAFLNNDFPVIICLELHCGPHQQKTLAELLVKHLGPYLFCELSNEYGGEHLNTELTDLISKPEDTKLTPNKLKNKYLLKCRVGKGYCSQELMTDDHKDLDGMPKEVTQAAEAHNSKVQSLHPIWQRTNPALSMLTTLWATHFINFETRMNELDEHFLNTTKSINSISSQYLYEELHYRPTETVAINKKGLGLVYPSGEHWKSENIDAHDAWALGFQMVAMNYQTNDVPMNTYAAFFRANGGCGYVLKPTYLCYNREADLYDPFEDLGCPGTESIKVTVISGHQIPNRTRLGHDKLEDELDPYVEIGIKGAPIDNIPDNAEGRSRITTTVIENNSYMPVWNERFDITVHYPALAVIVFFVWDWEPQSDTLVAEAYIPVHMIRPGFRSIPLSIEQNPIPNAYLFCHFSFQSVGDPGGGDVRFLK